MKKAIRILLFSFLFLCVMAIGITFAVSADEGTYFTIYEGDNAPKSGNAVLTQADITGLSDGAIVKLERSMTITTLAAPTGSLLLDLAGNTLTFGAATTVPSGASLFVYSSEPGGKLVGTKTFSVSGKLMLGAYVGYGEGNVKIENRAYQNNLSAGVGVLADLTASGELHILGGTYTRNVASSNAMIRVPSTAENAITIENAKMVHDSAAVSSTDYSGNGFFILLDGAKTDITITNTSFVGNKFYKEKSHTAVCRFIFRHCDLTGLGTNPAPAANAQLIAEEGTVFRSSPKATPAEGYKAVLTDESNSAWITGGGYLVRGGVYAIVKEGETLSPLQINLLPGASIRLSEPTGIRFTVQVGESTISKFTDSHIDYTVGLLILPTDLLNGELTISSATATNLEIGLSKVTHSDGFYTVYGSLTDLLPQNICRSFSARAYIKVGDSVIYSDMTSRAAYDVAKAMWADRKENSESGYENAISGGTYSPYTQSQLNIVRTFLDGVVEITDLTVDGQITLASIPNYVSPHEVDFADNLLTVTKGNEVKTILLDDKVYTGGWNVGGDGTLTAEYSPTGTVLYTLNADEPSKSFPIRSSFTAGGIYYAVVKAKGTDANHRLTVNLKSGSTSVRSYSYFIPTQLTEIWLPFEATGAETELIVSLESGGSFEVSKPTFSQSDTTLIKSKTGTYLVNDGTWTYTEVSTASVANTVHANGSRSSDCITVGNHLFVVSDGYLVVYEIGDSGYTKLYTSEKLGELRQMALTDDQKGLLITARTAGVYAFDITDPANPTIVSHIDSLEMATGLDVFGSFLYVADRTFGIDIFDISDLANPVFVSNAPTGETQDVCYYYGYLYGGIWGKCNVVIVDARDVDNPTIISTINLSGKGDGVWVRDGYLYAATGHFVSNDSSRTGPGYGLGNGFEIWDVSNPASPVRCSVTRADGAMYYNYPDIWRLYTVGNYAVVSNAYAGSFIYDVTDKTAPVRVAEYQVLGEGGNSLWSQDRFIFPYQPGRTVTESKKPFAVIDAWVDGDKIYFCCGNYGDGNNIYVADLPLTLTRKDSNNSSPSVQSSSYDLSWFDTEAELKTVFGADAKLYRDSNQIHAVAVRGNYLYLAAGKGGIIVLDKTTMQKVEGGAPSLDLTQDIQIKGDYLYTVEGTAGIAIYTFNETDPAQLTLVGHSKLGTFMQLQLSPDGRYGLVQSGNSAALIDLRDKTNPVMYEACSGFSMVYQYQISIGCIANRYLMVSCTSSGKLYVYDFGENGSYETPVITVWKDSNSSAYNGMTADGDYVFVSSGSNAYRFQLFDTSVFNKGIKEQFTASGSYGGNKNLPVIIGDYLFGVSRKNGNFAIGKLNTTHTSSSQILSYTFHGNPAVTVSDGERYYLPLSYGGILSFSLN